MRYIARSFHVQFIDYNLQFLSPVIMIEISLLQIAIEDSKILIQFSHETLVSCVADSDQNTLTFLWIEFMID